MIKLKGIGKVCRIFTVIWIQMMGIPVEMLNLVPYRNGCCTQPHTCVPHTHLFVHMCTAHIHTQTVFSVKRVKLNIPDKNNTPNS